MRKFITALATAALVGAGLIAMGAPASATNEDAPGHNKVYICHVTPGNSVTLYIPEDEANGHITGTAGNHGTGPVKDYFGECKEDPKPPVVTTEYAYWCDATTPKSASRKVTDGKPGKWEPTDPPEGYKSTPQTCTTPPPPPTEPPAPPAPPAGPPAPPTDYCANLEGVQWEGYDCNTGVVPPVVATPEPTPTQEPTATPAPKPQPAVDVPDKPTVPESVPAGDGSSQDSFPWIPMILIAAAAGVLGSVLRMRYSRK